MNDGRPSLEEVREKLRAHGYLDAGIERTIFTAPRVSGAIAPSVLAGAAAFAAAEAGAVLARGEIAPRTGVALFWLLGFAALLPVATLAGAFLFFFSRVLRATLDPKKFSALAGAVAAAAVFLLFTAAVRSLPGASSGEPIAAVALVSVAAFYFARAVRATVLSLALRRQIVELGRPPLFRRVAAWLVLILAVVSLLSSRPGAPPSPPPPLQVSPRRHPLVVAAVDGVPGESLPLIAPGAPWVAWRRAAALPPEVWTTIATGSSPRRHGVAAFERVSLFGRVALAPPYGSSWLLRGPFHGLKISERIPVSARQRRLPAFWEIAARAGIATEAVNWWASEEVAGAEVVDNAEIARLASTGAEDDAAAIARFRSIRARRRPGLSTIYLPGADITRGPLTVAAREFLEAEIASARRGEENFWIISDAGRSGLSGGIAFVDEAAAGSESKGSPFDAAPSILARLGVPPARDLDGTPLRGIFSSGALESGSVETYGPRGFAGGAPRSSPEGQEYLRRLKSLGYLN